MAPVPGPRHHRFAIACLCALLTACTSAATRAGSLVICADLTDAELTHASFEHDAAGGLTQFDIVTPDALWPAPGQRETPRFSAGQSDVSPNLVAHPDVRVDTIAGHDGALRVIDFASRTADALPLDDLRGSLMLHEAFHDQHAIGSLYITASGHRASITPVLCRRFVPAAQ